jgi:predicted nucleotidyltransferase
MGSFIAACHADLRVVAAFLGGSYARGSADAYSDLDLYLITTDKAYEDFVAGRKAFLQRLGELVFLEDFDLPNTMFFIFSNGVEGELGFGRESQYRNIHGGPYQILLDKKRILEGAVFSEIEPEQVEQVELLRRQIHWFWHEISHFITALGRGQLWWPYGQLEALRGICVNLARLGHNFSDAEVGEEPYFKVDKAIPVEQLAPLQTTFCPLEPGAMLQSVFVIVRFYQELVPMLAQTHGISYPAELERLLVARLEKLKAGESQ